MDRVPVFGTFDDFSDMLEYIKAYPQNFLEYIQEGVISDMPEVLDALIGYYNWWGDEFERWRENEQL